MTDEATLNVIEMVLGEINQELVGLINKFGAKAVGLERTGRPLHPRAAHGAAAAPNGRRGARPRPRRRGREHRSRRHPSAAVARLHSGDHADRRRRRRHRLSHQLRCLRRAARANAARRKADPHDQRARHPRPRRQARVRPDRERGRSAAARRRRRRRRCSRARRRGARGRARGRALGAHHRRRRAERAAARGADEFRHRHGDALRRGPAFPRRQPQLLRGQPSTDERGHVVRSRSAKSAAFGICTSARIGSRARCASRARGRSSSSTRAT